MDTGHVATQWGHTTDLSHLGKLTLLSGGGGSVWELRAPATASTAPMGSSPCLVEHREHPRAHQGSSEAPDPEFHSYLERMGAWVRPTLCPETHTDRWALRPARTRGE